MSAGRRRVLLLVGAVMVLDYAIALLAQVLTLPFYLDTWATSTGVIVGGLGVGVAGGVLYNLLMAATVWEAAAWVWCLSSATAAVCTWYFLRLGWVSIERPFAMLASGVLTGVVNGCLALAISLVVFGSAPTTDTTRAFRDLLQASIGSSWLAQLCANLVIEVADKTVSIIAAAATAFLLQDTYRTAHATRTGDGQAAPARFVSLRPRIRRAAR